MKKFLIFVSIASLLICWCDHQQKNAKEVERLANENLQKIYNLDYSKLAIEQKDGFHYYYNSYFTHKNNENRISIYICRYHENSPYLRLKISSNRANSAKADYIYLYADDKIMEIPCDVYKVAKVKGGAYVDLMIGNMLTEHLLDMSKAISASVRFFNYSTGIIQEYYITPEEKQAIPQIVNSLTYLKAATQKP